MTGVTMTGTPSGILLEKTSGGITQCFVWNPEEKNPRENVYNEWEDIMRAINRDEDDIFADNLREWNQEGILDDE